MGPGAEAWFRGCIAVAEILRPEWLEEPRVRRRQRIEWERYNGYMGADPSLDRLAKADFGYPPEG